MDDARALLDSLMGPSRNQAPKAEDNKKKGEPDFAARNVCKNFLVGFCPHDWFTVNKRQLEPCTKIHSEFLKGQFEAHPDLDKWKEKFEDEFLAYLEKVTADCDTFIARERLKCRQKGSGIKKMALPPAEQEKVDELEARYAKLIKEAEEMADQSVSKSGELTEQALAVKEQAETLKARHTVEFPGEEVCETCGVRYALAGGGLSEFHGREAHLNGRTHEGYTEIRAKVAELREKKRLRERERDKEREREREKEWEKKKESQREKDKDRERDGDKDRKQDAEKLKNGAKDRSRSRRNRSASRKERDSKGKGKEKEREKGKDRSRSADKSRAKGREKRRGKDSGSERSRSRSRGKKSKGGERKGSRSRRGRKKHSDSSSS